MSRSKINVEDLEDNSDVGFVSRWSRLKHETRQHNDEIASDDTVVDKTAVDKTSMQTVVSDEEQAAPVKILTDDDMPDLESMTPDSDYTDFLSPGVSEELRKLALRKLFRSEVFNIRDGLDEYDGDYTHFEKLGDIVTSDMKHQLELEAKRKAEQMLQQAPPLADDDRADDDCASEQDLDHKDLADKNKIAACEQEMSQLSNDDEQTSMVKDVTSNNMVTENLAADDSLSVDAGTEKSTEESTEESTKKPDENTGSKDLPTNNTDQNKG